MTNSMMLTTDDRLSMATLVNSRFKTHYIQTNQRLWGPMMDEWRTWQSSPTASEVSPSITPVIMQKKTLSSFFKRPVSTSGLTDQEAGEAEVNSYLQAPNADGETNPLEWWKTHCTAYPRLSLLAKRYLCIPATSSPSERAFSTGGNVLAQLWPATEQKIQNNRFWMMYTST